MSLYSKVMDKVHARLNLWVSHGDSHPLASPHDHLTIEGELWIVIDSLRFLKQELDRAEDDAIRYRAIRRAVVCEDYAFVNVMDDKLDELTEHSGITGATFDQCVDAAIVETSMRNADEQHG